jgi:hypothetical protein
MVQMVEYLPNKSETLNRLQYHQKKKKKERKRKKNVRKSRELNLLCLSLVSQSHSS